MYRSSLRLIVATDLQRNDAKDKEPSNSTGVSSRVESSQEEEMTYDPNRDPYSSSRPAYADEGSGTALFIGALVLLALVFGGVYFYANERSPQVASEMTINNAPNAAPTTRPMNSPTNPPATLSPAPEAAQPAPTSRP
jgi:hypothetical protein